MIFKIIIFLVFLKNGYCADSEVTEADSEIAADLAMIFPSNPTLATPTTETNSSSLNQVTDLPTTSESNTATTSTNVTLDSDVSSLVTLPADIIGNTMTEIAVTEEIIKCPVECKCAASLVDAICTGRRLNDIPLGFSSHVKMLILTSNNITEIGENSFKERNLFELMSLLMNHNRIQSLHPNAFVVLKHLEVLDLGDNSLTIIDPDIFASNLALATLRLDSNTKLQLPASGALINAPTLRDLNISSCNISFLPTDIFSGTPILDTIDLSDNNLKDLNPTILKSLPDLITLILPKSFEPKLSEVCLVHTKLEKIVIRNKGNEENIQCTELQPNIEKQPIPEIILPINQTLNTEKIEATTEFSLTSQNISNFQLFTGDLSQIINSTEQISEVQVAPQEDKISRIVIQTRENKIKTFEESNTAASQGLSGSQIDNIIIGILLTVITVTLIAILINLNKRKIDKVLHKNKRPEVAKNEFECEPLQNVVLNP